MSITVLFDLRSEVTRLFVAGSGMAAGDRRLLGMLPGLQKLGETAPVFQRIASAVQQAIEAAPPASAAALLELGALLNAVLYTQGKSDVPGELTDVEGTAYTTSTAVPYRKLQPLLEALTQKGQGRLEQLQAGFEQRLFHDFRVIPAAVRALDDGYSEIPEFLHKSVLPQYGMEALYELRSQFRMDGGKGAARRLELIHGLLGLDALELLLEAAEAGSVEVRAAAVELLGHYPEQLPLVLEQADDKKKEIRSAAYYALSRIGSDEAIRRLHEALASKDRELAIEPVRLCETFSMALTVIGSSEQLLAQIESGEEVSRPAQQLLANLRSLEGKPQPEVTELLIRLLSSAKFVASDTDDVQVAAADMLLDTRQPEADRFALTLDEKYNRKFISYSFRAAYRLLPAAELFDRFAPLLKSRRNKVGNDLIAALYKTEYDLDDPRSPGQTAFDPRWVTLLAGIDEEELVCRLATGADREIEAYLLKKCKEKPNFGHFRTVRLLSALHRIGYGDMPELLMSILEGGGKRQLYYLDDEQLGLLRQLPPSYGDRLRAFAETLTYESVKRQVLDVADSLADQA
ncbi:HEAT repeat domain-containing protein [Paenibacillus ginsengarvi]|uniref:HEAT repeat domain-containing protein n=1 Tax=Paenibacillus ginsengarvi TaxID=400777 RepID=A0A3B0BSR3_9BACL|nr:HEAT repeat domain-containing protein [Paenibacillus ginsengarvi]RKN75962.1 HEAT repeat domain-containing protein [Paenibacillus ginsengarvi]